MSKKNTTIQKFLKLINYGAIQIAMIICIKFIVLSTQKMIHTLFIYLV